MKIILAPDKYKGSLTGLQFCDIVTSVLNTVDNTTIIQLPLADGGDGTIEVVNYYLKGTTIEVLVKGPKFNPVRAKYLYSSNTKTAFIEMAEASGLKLLNQSDQNCMQTTTFGTGQLILNAIEQGAKQIFIGIGGSATNDCGIGMASALGYQFYNENNQLVNPIGSELINIERIDDANVDERLRSVKIHIACDVTNPLYGPNGAAYVYAKQKGASAQEIEFLDQGLISFSKILDRHFNIDVQQFKGSGAAGGMGAGCITFLNATLLPGIELIKQIADFDSKVKKADWIITGEGRLDSQTLSGKALSGILSSAKKENAKVAALCGSIELSDDVISDVGISYADSIMNYADSVDDAIKNVRGYLKYIAERFCSKKLTH